MESDPGKRQSRDNFATSNSRPGPQPNNEAGSRSTPVVSQTNSQSTLDLQEPEGYATQAQKGQSLDSNPSPRSDAIFLNSPATRRSRVKEQQPVLEPPVTKITLSELDVNKIVNNPKLRHDINFDPELHFRPNLDGEKGRRKAQKAHDFWETMKSQLREFLVNREGFDQQIGGDEWALPATLSAIRGILETLVPQKDRASVEETFNVELLMQQFRKGVADMVKLANWLSQLLKCHCAPMRDDWVDEMVVQLSNGDRNGDVALLALGMKNLLSVLEAMKLDVANHQIRCLRPLLIDDTVHFEQKFFMKKIAMGRIQIAGAHAWYRNASSLPDPIVHGSVNSQGNTWDFIKALVNLTMPSKSNEMAPQTFLFDEERIIKLRSDMLDLVNIEICMSIYYHLLSISRSNDSAFQVHDETSTTSFAASPCDRPESPSDNAMLSSPTIPLPHHFTRNPASRQACIRDMEYGHATSSSSNTSSAYSSPSSISSTLDSHLPTPPYLSLSTTDSASQLRTSLLAILSSSTTSDKWASLSSSVALQILRSTTTPLNHLPEFESHLASRLFNTGSTYYQEAESRVLAQFLPILKNLVDSYTSLTSLQIFEAATSSKPSFMLGTAPLNAVKEEMTEIATRMAHIGIIHWRVWAPLAYLVDPDAEEELQRPNERAKSVP